MTSPDADAPGTAESGALAAASVLEAAGIGRWSVRPGENTVQVDATAQQLLGLSAERAEIGALARGGTSGEREALLQDFAFAMDGRGTLDTAIRLEPAGGEGRSSYVALRGRLLEVPGTGKMLVGACWALRDGRRLPGDPREEAFRDRTSGLYNRAFFDPQLEREWRISMRERRDLALVFVDIDDFAEYRELHGESSTEPVLAGLGELLGSIPARPADLAARYGESRLAMLLPNTDLDGAVHLAERVIAGFRGDAGLSREVKDGRTLSLSIGVGNLGPSATALGFEVLVARTEAAARSARKRGGDNIQIWQEHMPEAPAQFD